MNERLDWLGLVLAVSLSLLWAILMIEVIPQPWAFIGAILGGIGCGIVGPAFTRWCAKGGSRS